MANLAVIGVLFKRFYGYLVVLGIFALFGGVVTLKVGVSRKRDKNFATDDYYLALGNVEHRKSSAILLPCLCFCHESHRLQKTRRLSIVFESFCTLLFLHFFPHLVGSIAHAGFIAVTPSYSRSVKCRETA